MVEQIKIENKSTTTYTPAKNRMGCKAPIAVEVLEFIRIEFLYFSKGLDLRLEKINNSISKDEFHFQIALFSLFQIHRNKNI